VRRSIFSGVHSNSARRPYRHSIPMASICTPCGIKPSIRWHGNGAWCSRLPPVQPRSRRAFELAEFARTKGRFDEVHRGLFKAFFEDGGDIDNLDTLVTIGTAVGLDGETVRAALEQGICRERVIQDEREAANLGITAVPTVMIGRAERPLKEAEAISGAQPYEVIKATVERLLPHPA
jgi:predicted DsbA family dithiol-disulfide isomerase